MGAALCFVSVFAISLLAIPCKRPIFCCPLVLVNVRKSFQGSLKNKLLLVKKPCVSPMFIHPNLEVFVVQLNGADVVVEIPFSGDSGNESVITHELDVHESPSC